MRIQNAVIITFLSLATSVSLSQAQTNPLEPFFGPWSVKSSTFGSTEAQVSYTPVADSMGVIATWIQGKGDTYYEAKALMGYDAGADKVKVFEVNNQGVAAFQEGHFNKSGELNVVRRSENGNKILERRVFQWPDKNTLKMSAFFYSKSDTVKHSVILKREK